MLSYLRFQMDSLLHYLLWMFVFDSTNGEEYHHCIVVLDFTVIDGVCAPMNHGQTTPKNECHPAPLCKRNFNITSVQTKAYSPELVSDLLSTCCGPCLGTSQITNIERLGELTPSLMNMSDFVFPVLGRQTTSSLYGFYFIPLIETPHVYFISVKRISQIRDLLESCLFSLWPPTILLALMVLISGFICWAMETRGNKDQFPRPFLEGWGEGVWWSFITITTVGYGDKAPKSTLGRLFTVIWVFVGISIFTLLTAIFTAEIYMVYAEPAPSMAEKRVGVVHHHLYETMLISSKDGIIVDVAQPNMTEGIHKLVSLLRRKEIDGFVFDKYELMLFYKFFNEDERYKEDVKYLQKNSLLTEVTYSEELLYGVLVKDEREYTFLRDFMISNRDVINNCNSLLVHNYSRTTMEEKQHGLFYAGGDKFWPSFNFCMICLAVILMIGGLYELQRKKRYSAIDYDDEHDECRIGWSNLEYLRNAMSKKADQLKSRFRSSQNVLHDIA